MTNNQAVKLSLQKCGTIFRKTFNVNIPLPYLIAIVNPLLWFDWLKMLFFGIREQLNGLEL